MDQRSFEQLISLPPTDFAREVLRRIAQFKAAQRALSVRQFERSQGR